MTRLQGNVKIPRTLWTPKGFAEGSQELRHLIVKQSGAGFGPPRFLQ
jgi:hypothetical protein